MAIKNDTQFVIKNGVAIQPDIPHDGLELYYDVKGKKNTDNYKSTLLDMSGKGRHGTLSNFAYEGVSGFTGTPEGGLLLDDVDDKIVRPAISGIEYTSASRNLLNLTPVSFSAAGITISNTSTTVTLAGTSTGTLSALHATFTSSWKIKLAQGTYAISPTSKTMTNFGVTVGVFNGVSLLNQSAVNGSASFTCEEGEYTVGVYVPSGAALGSYIFNLQIEKNPVATVYTPYIPLPIMTYQMNGNVLSFEKDGTVKRTTRDVNGNRIVVSRKGINLVRNGNFADGKKYWSSDASFNLYVDDNRLVAVSSNTAVGTQAIYSGSSIGRRHGQYFYVKGKVTAMDNVSRIDIRIGGVAYGSIVPTFGIEYNLEALVKIENTDISNQLIFGFAKINPSITCSLSVSSAQAINLTEAYGAGNEPTLAYIQAHPEEFAWTPNPNDLIETVEIKNNLVGDIENLQGNDFEQHEDGVVTYTNEAEEGSVVRVDIDGISDQPLRFRNATGEQVVITEHDQVDADAIKKVEFQGNSVQLADKYREVSGTSVMIAPELHDRNVADKLVIGGNTYQYTESSNVVTDGLEMWLSGRNFSNSPATTVWKDLTGVNNGTASGFAFTTASGSDGAGGVVFDGVDDYIATPITVPRSGTIEMWYTPSAVNYNYNTLWDNSADTEAFECWIYNTGKLHARSLNTATAVYSQSNLIANVKYHVVYSWSSIDNSQKLYIDGILNNSNNALVFGSPTTINIAGKINTKGRGKMDSFRVYNRALSDAEVLQNYNAGLAIPIPNIAMPQEVKHVTSGSKIITHKKNFFDVSKITNLAWGLGDILLTSASYKGWYMPVKQGEVYSLSRSSTINNRFGIYFLATEPTANSPVFATPSYREDTGLKIENVQVPVGAKYIFVYLSNQSDTLPNIQLELGQNATTYEVFTQTKTTIPVTLKSIG